MTTDIDREQFRKYFAECRKEGENTRNWKKVWKEYKQNLSYHPNDIRHVHDICFRLHLNRIKATDNLKKKVDWKAVMKQLMILVFGMVIIYTFAKSIETTDNNSRSYHHYYYRNNCHCDDSPQKDVIDTERKKRKVNTYLRRLEILSSANKKIEEYLQKKDN